MLEVLIYLRYLAVAGQVLTILFVGQRLGLGIPTGSLLGISAALLAFNVATHAWWLRRRDAGARMLVFQLLVDMLALTGLLYFTGGPGNPFVSLYLVPVALAAIGLDVVPMVGLTLLAAVLYTALLSHHVPLPMIHGRDFELHVLGMWANFLLTAMIMVVTLGRLMSVVKDQRRALSVARERALRDESLLAIGSLAAGTAHELNTPLTTMGLLLDDWADSATSPSTADLSVMRAQLATCRDHVRVLVDIARRGAFDEPRIQPASLFIHDCIARWQMLRPGVRITVAPMLGVPSIFVDATLPQAVINLLNNAADANARVSAESSVDVDSETRAARWLLRISDRGPGPKAIRTEDDRHAHGAGLGIGLMISNASIERSGGRVRQYARDGGGCVTEVELPIIGDEP